MSDNHQSTNMNTDASAFNPNKPIKSWTPGNFTGAGSQFSSAAPSFTPTAPSFNQSQGQPFYPQGNTSFQPMPQPQTGFSPSNMGSSFNPNAPVYNRTPPPQPNNFQHQQSWGQGQQSQPYQPQMNSWQGGNQGYQSQPQQPMYNPHQGGNNYQNNGGYRGPKQHFKQGGYQGKQQWNPNHNNGGQSSYKPRGNQYNNNQGGYQGNQDGGFGNSSFKDFNASGQHQNTFKIANTQLDAPMANNFEQQAQKNTPTIPAWKKFVGAPKVALPKRDPIGDKLKDVGIEDEGEQKVIKNLLTLIKASKDKKLTQDQKDEIQKMEPINPLKQAEKKEDSAAPSAENNIRKSYIDMVERRTVPAGSFNMRLFLKFGELQVCQTQKVEPKDIEHCCAKIVVEREVKDTVEAIRKGGYKDRNDRGNRDRRNHRNDEREGGEGGNFERGTAKPQRLSRDNGGSWLKEDNQERAELRKKAQEIRSKIGAPKSTIQKIKLILNRITPDNYDRNKKELKNYLFGEQFKTKDECFDEEITYVEAEHQMQPENINEEILETIVSNIFRKAQMEKEYIIFYGQLCEALIRNELLLRGLECKVSTMAQSTFRKCLFDHCKTTFEKFFDQAEKKKHTQVLQRTVDKSKMTPEERAVYTDELEKAVIFQTKLFGNNEFVGELYRRKLLPEKTLFYVFESLLGFSDLNDDVDDLVIEGAITLMEKIGPVLDENVKKSKKEDKQANLDKVFDRFALLMDTKDQPPQNSITNRVKLLIKNMFANRQSGWQRTKDLNSAGPKTKKQVQDEMEEKQNRERDTRDGGGHRDRYNNDRDRDNRDRRDGRNNQRDRRDTKQPEPKKQYQAKAQTKEPAQGKKGKLGDKKDYFDDKDQVVKIDQEEMDAQVKANFVDYVRKIKQLEEIEGDDEESKAQVDDLQPSYELFSTLQKVNGRTGDDILGTVLTQAFADGDDERVKTYLQPYLRALYDGKRLTAKDFAGGISRFSVGMPDLTLDFPQAPEYTWKYVLQPLLAKEIVSVKDIDWKAPEKIEDGGDDDDEDLVFGTDPFFKLLALVLAWGDSEGFDAKQIVAPWKEVIKERHPKIDNRDELWSDIQNLIGEESTGMIRPLLDAPE